MAINRKGMRKIVVDDAVYYYKISARRTFFHDSEIKLVIEKPSGEVETYKFERDDQYIPFTPKDVRTVIKEGSHNGIGADC